SYGESVARNDKGEVVETGSAPGGGWQEIIPGSIAEGVWRVACAASQPPKEKPILADLGAGSWTSFGASADGKYVVYAALDRVARVDAGHVAVLTRSDYVKPEWVDGLPIRYMLAAVIMDCANRKTAGAGVDMYMSPTIRVRSARAKDLKFESLAPG